MPLGIPIRFSCDIGYDGRIVVTIRIIDIVSIIINRILIIIRYSYHEAYYYCYRDYLEDYERY